jgi:DNA-binding CsgD family transcriptional regulator
MTTTLLSRREHEVIVCLGRGLPYKGIACSLGISIDTVRSHIRNGYDKLKATNRIEALRNLQLFERGQRPSKKTSTRIPVLC